MDFVRRALCAAAFAFTWSSAAAAEDRLLRAGPLCSSPSQALNEQGFVPAGGIEHWVTVRGSACSNPVILMLHGGPGNPLSPYSAEIFGSWEKHFTLVQWDQRGAGKTFGRNPGSADTALTLALMSKDGTDLAAELGARLGVKTIILAGGSWGSILGVHMIKSKPQLFSAYVGVSQLVSFQDNMTSSYLQTISLARAAGDEKTVAALEALGAPP
jgi:pimeloyl-ACP methyl ester carboxylesterase